MAEEKAATPMATLTGELSHNALAAAVQMYQALIQDHGRVVAMLQATVKAQRVELVAAEERRRALEMLLEERAAAASAPKVGPGG